MKQTKGRGVPKVRSRPKLQRDPCLDATTFPGIKPGDFAIGSLQSRAAARAILTSKAEKQQAEEEALLAHFTPSEQASIRASIEDVEKPEVRTWMILLARVARERAIVYERNLPFSPPEEIRHNRAVFQEINRLTAGRASSLQTNNMEEWNRLKHIAEQNLRGKKK